MGYGVNADDSLKEEASQREDSKKEVLRMEIESRSENEPDEPYDGGD